MNGIQLASEEVMLRSSAVTLLTCFASLKI